MREVVIPCHEKDLITLPLTTQSVEQLINPDRIWIVAASRLAGEIERRTGLKSTNENDILPGVTDKYVAHPRWTWYFQQILKLQMSAVVSSEYYLVVDGDTIFLRPPVVFDGTLPVYATTDHYHVPYLRAISELLGFEPAWEYSFITHYMLFSRVMVRRMLELITGRYPWWDQVAQFVEPRPPEYSFSQFSEYETYGQYLKHFHPGSFRTRPSYFATLSTVPDARELTALAKTYDICACHAYLRDPEAASASPET